MGLFQKLFGSQSDREIKKIRPIADAVLALEAEYAAMSEQELRGQTAVFKARLAEDPDMELDDILPRAFATVREASFRVLGMKHYPVQIIGGIALHQGRIAEMKTGEGKTLVATLPTYLNALSGEGVHVVTVNEYLARRDSEWMGKVYRYLGLSVGLVVSGMKAEEKRESYACDITYGTSSEFGFDYLRDNMVVEKSHLTQRGHSFAIVDEVDSILIDEARTPLIISGRSTNSSAMYSVADQFVRTLRPFKIIHTDSKADYDKFASREEYDELTMSQFITPEQHEGLKKADYIIDEKSKQVTLTALGVAKAEKSFHLENLADPANMTISHHINQALRAHSIMKRDIDYVVKNGQVLIVDEFTGRIMYGRRYNQGLHQAIEAKEHVKIADENQTVATITLQNYFRLYSKLSGMTGTAMTEKDEFESIYGLDVVEIPTNRPGAREDLTDLLYKSEAAKYNAVIEQIVACHEKGQPVLVGTISIERSELLSKLLKKRGIEHNVLNAKHHEKEASIIAQAGHYGAVTIATNMAGRGTDIILGGNAEFMAKEEMRKKGYEDRLIAEATGFAETDDEEILEARETYQTLYNKFKDAIKEEAEKVVAAGGLYIIGTERHESRRIDNQLRGRAGRQGDPGTTRFYLSGEDDLMRRFGGERFVALMNAFNLPEDQALDFAMFASAVERAQKTVESNNFAARKHVLEYDDIANKQRAIIYEQRRTVLDNEDLRASILKMIPEVVEALCAPRFISEDPDLWDIVGLQQDCEFLLLGYALPTDKETVRNMAPSEFESMILERAQSLYYAKEKEYPEIIREVERAIMLRCVDTRWMQHIDDLEELKQGIGLLSYGQKNPLTEYSLQSADMFDEMVLGIKMDTLRMLLSLVIKSDEDIKREQMMKETSAGGGDGTNQQGKTVKVGKKVGPNEPCPCGSGKKYKKCCGQR
ncbi:MAG: preprotein translocase subunit SecA [Clostridia bacterium]|nr:preprotein translocase subunit SecA [Clostridia bacterium]